MKRFLIATGLVVAVAVAAAVGYAAIPDSQGTIHACMLNATGAIRLIDHSLDTQTLRSHCTTAETEVTWSQRGPAGESGPPGPQGPPGNTDSTVRHISNFMLDGSSVTTPILSAKGELGKLAISCNHDANGGNGTVGFTETSDPAFQARVSLTSLVGPAALRSVDQ